MDRDTGSPGNERCILLGIWHLSITIMPWTSTVFRLPKTFPFHPSSKSFCLFRRLSRKHISGCLRGWVGVGSFSQHTRSVSDLRSRELLSSCVVFDGGQSLFVKNSFFLPLRKSLTSLSYLFLLFLPLSWWP